MTNDEPQGTHSVVDWRRLNGVYALRSPFTYGRRSYPFDRAVERELRKQLDEVDACQQRAWAASLTAYIA